MDQFNPSLGTLQSITFEHDWSGEFLFGQDIDVGYEWLFTNTIATSDGDVLFQSSKFELFGASDASQVTRSIENTAAPSVTIENATILSLFTGSGQIELTQQLSGEFRIVSGSSSFLQEFTAEVQAAWADNLTVTYTHDGVSTVIPIPATFVLYLTALAGFFGVGFRKRVVHFWAPKQALT